MMKVPTEEQNPNYKNILELDKKLTELKIPHKLRRLYDGWQILYFRKGREDEAYGDVVCHCGSYGHEKDLMEAYGFPECEDDVIGYMSVDEALELFINANA